MTKGERLRLEEAFLAGARATFYGPNKALGWPRIAFDGVARYFTLPDLYARA
jgi:hypothetical protein